MSEDVSAKATAANRAKERLEFSVAKPFSAILAERDALAKEVEQLYKECFQHIRDKSALRADKADLVEEIQKAVELSDEALKACPYSKGSFVSSARACKVCGATASETCYRSAGADFRAMEAVRAVLAKHGEQA